MNRPAHRTAAAALAASLLLVFAACGDDDDNTAAQDPTPTPSGAGIIGGPSTSGSSSGSSSASTDESASPSASADAEDGQTIEIDLVDGKPTEKIGTVTVSEGDELTLVVTSDKAYEVHVHGLDISIKVDAGDTETKTFTVDLSPGSYEVEVEETGFLLFNLKVE